MSNLVILSISGRITACDLSTAMSKLYKYGGRVIAII